MHAAPWDCRSSPAPSGSWSATATFADATAADATARRRRGANLRPNLQSRCTFGRNNAIFTVKIPMIMTRKRFLSADHDLQFMIARRRGGAGKGRLGAAGGGVQEDLQCREGGVHIERRCVIAGPGTIGPLRLIEP